MLTAIVFVVSFVVYGIEGGTTENVNGVKLECHIKKYDLDGDSMVTKEEFLTVTQDFKEMDTNILFQRLDKNGDQTIETEEFKDVDPSIIKTGIFNHCRRLRCRAFCFSIIW
ncbi:uncharacterized protein LOC128156596 [Crassostrea angulata]|uniref:uncharacterized protein LOC128156596 n=1 Tax=Magallana angulata TaxID=2784310 RepID=UPI0022B09F30|nr:uncharacterized protein LOC128156596 [Crassostrea angulata]